MSNSNSPRSAAIRFVLFVAMILLGSISLLAQSTVGTGSIQGTVTDQTGAVVANAKVAITNKATASTIHLTVSSAGSYSSGAIQPGDYLVRAEAKGFKTVETPVTVQVGNTATVSPKLVIGQESQVIEVQGSAVAVNTEQATVQGVLNIDQIENLPVNGRNFLDLAQLEPGVQIQEGSTFDPTKNGFSSISFQGRFGRTARIEVDGVDVSDETTGASTQNISPSAIHEFQLPESLLDLSAGSASSTVNIITRSGSDQLHGAAFGVYRGDQGAAPLPASSAGSNSSFQREQFGGNAGGAIIKDKVFLFADAERTQQNLTSIEPFSFPFNTLDPVLAQPYREFDTDERVDWNMRGSTRAFYRFNYYQNSDMRPDGSATSAQQLRSTNNTATNTLGVDFNTGVYAHSLRFEYLKLRNDISDATSGLNAADNPIPGLGINIGAPTAGNCVLSGASSYCGGPSWLGPQKTDQSDKLARYDGSRVLGEHLFFSHRG